jgi:hypothetical protein
MPKAPTLFPLLEWFLEKKEKEKKSRDETTDFAPSVRIEIGDHQCSMSCHNGMISPQAVPLPAQVEWEQRKMQRKKQRTN